MKQTKQKYRLGIDMGSTSIGWCMLKLDEDNNPCGVINMGVRIFPDGRDDKSKEPLSVSRRTYRGMRRNLDRYLDRQTRIRDFFDLHSWLPQDDNERKRIYTMDPVALRKEALERKLTLAELARAYIHLSKRRGFKSNRKTDKEAKTQYTEAIANLNAKLQDSGALSLGEYLWKRNCLVPLNQRHLQKPAKFRYDKGLSDEERIFPTRAMVEDEFELIWSVQAAYHSNLTDELKNDLKNIIFYQRPLRAQEVGKCTLEPEEKRCPKAYPLFQEARLRQDINHLKLVNAFDYTTRELTQEERDTIYAMLDKKEKVTFKTIRRELLGKATHDDYRFNSETENKDKLHGNLTNHAFAKDRDTGIWWEALTPQRQKEVIDIMLNDELSDETVCLLIRDMEADAELAEKILNLRTPEGYGNLSEKALNNILPYLRQGHIYSQACELAGYNHSGKYNGEVFDHGDLPYYGALLKTSTLPLARTSHDKNADEFGKINNPTVHIALNQLRLIVNTLTSKFGGPAEVSLELARELKLGQKQNEEINATIRRNTKANEKIADELAKLSLQNNAENRLRYKLWEELSDDPLKRCCVYCGRQISVSDAYSPQVHIEHILPKSRTFDDNISNKTLAHLSCNNEKGERSPWEAFGTNKGKYDWQAICERTASLPANKRWRFREDAMQQFENEEKLIDRMLNDTRYMSRVAAEYMQYVTGRTAVPVTGKLTEVLRRKWGLNQLIGEDNTKDRTDHRHHAIDAFVIAMTDRSLVKQYADSIKRSRERFVENLHTPYPDFKHEELQLLIDKMTVSYKPDQPNPSILKKRNQTAGGLLEETAYHYLGQDKENPKYGIFCTRKNIADITPDKIDDIRDESGHLKKRLYALLERCDRDEKAFTAKLSNWSKTHNVKKVKLLLKANPATMIPVRDKKGRIYKYYASGENLFADIYNPVKPGSPPKWEMEIVSSYRAHQDGFLPDWKRQYPWAKLIMRLYKNDIVAFTDSEGNRELRRVRKMSSGVLFLRELKIAKKPKGKEGIGEQFTASQLQDKNACKAGVDAIGRYFDPKGKTYAGDRA